MAVTTYLGDLWLTRTKCTELQKAMYHSIYIKTVNFLQPKHIRQTYIDPNGTSSDTYQVAPIVNGVEGEKAILSLRLQAARITLTFR